MSLVYFAIYVVLALIAVALAKGYRLRTGLVALALGMVVRFFVSFTDLKRVAVIELRTMGPVSPDMIRAIDAYKGLVQSEAVYMLSGAVVLAAVALLDVVRGRWRSRLGRGSS